MVVKLSGFTSFHHLKIIASLIFTGSNTWTTENYVGKGQIEMCISIYLYKNLDNTEGYIIPSSRQQRLLVSYFQTKSFLLPQNSCNLSLSGNTGQLILSRGSAFHLCFFGKAKKKYCHS